MICRTPLLLASLVARGHFADFPGLTDPTYLQTKNIVFAEVDGVGLVMDIFTPTGMNGLGIVDVASGALLPTAGRSRTTRAQVYDIFCGKGYTVFAVRPARSVSSRSRKCPRI